MISFAGILQVSTPVSPAGLIKVFIGYEVNTKYIKRNFLFVKLSIRNTKKLTKTLAYMIVIEEMVLVFFLPDMASQFRRHCCITFFVCDFTIYTFDL